jgi:multiple sugar transport system permease protein
MTSRRFARGALELAVYGGLTLVMVFPIYWLVITSLKPNSELQTNPPIFFPSQLNLGSYQQLLADADMRRFFSNSLVVAFGSTLAGLVIGCLAAYVLARSDLRYSVRRAVLLWVLLVRIFPPIVVGIPYFTVLERVGLTDTQVGLILVHVSLTLPFVIWLMMGFFQDLPADLERAAMLDGCSLARRFWRVSLPLVLPGLAVTAIFAFIISWNEYLFAAILTSFNAKTLPVVISGYISDKFLRWGEMSALGTAMVLPVVLFSAFVQRYLVRGLTFGAVKE